MRLMFDVNVVLDVIQKREPHYRYSAIVLSEVLYKKVEGVLAGHALTTVYYLVEKYADSDLANEKTDWLLEYFDIISADKPIFKRARSLPIKDFEDAVTALLAQTSACDYVVTRNIADFQNSPVSPITPEEFFRRHIVFHEYNKQDKDANNG